MIIFARVSGHEKFPLCLRWRLSKGCVSRGYRSLATARTASKQDFDSAQFAPFDTVECDPFPMRRYSMSDSLSLLVDERDIRRLVDRLFILTDQKMWDEGRALFVDGEITVDMSSLMGGGAVRMTAEQLFAGFAQGLHSGKASHHIAANYDIVVTGDAATVLAHGYSWNRVPGLEGGSELWETWGTYTLDCVRTPRGWRLTSFAYHAKLNRGNENVRTHSLVASDR
jgi:hypothetical protein